jgi:hypothetical protein
MTELVLVFGTLFVALFVSLSVTAFGVLAGRKGTSN